MLNLDATKEKELRMQVELYRFLRNYVDEGQTLFEGDNTIWTAGDVLIEASIEKPSGITKEADLVLMANRIELSRTINSPVLVIETKKRNLGYLTQHYGSALKQAREYAYAIKCPAYAVYDGHTLILMQIASPFLLGIHSWRPSDSNISNRDFARKIWNIAIEVNTTRLKLPVPQFMTHDDITPWKKSIFNFIKEAYRFKIEVDQGMLIEQFNIEKDTVNLMNQYLSILGQ